MNSLGGAAPEGAQDERSAATAVREMFDRVAPRYDLLNHLLSMNIDRLWWRRAAARYRKILLRPDARIADICCGTGQMAFALLRWRPPGSLPVLAADFSHQMLLRAAGRLPPAKAVLVEADALHLPVRDGTMDLVTTAFGFRNLANYQAGLEEFSRVLRPGGSIGILDFGEPDGAIGRLYSIYFHRVLPRIGSAISGVTGAYRYLPESVHRFPAPDRMLQAMRQAGFDQASWTPYNFGVAGLYCGVRS